MPLETALAAVDLLFSRRRRRASGSTSPSSAASRCSTAPSLRAATERAARLAAERGAQVTFSITTNGTLLTDEDGDFFEEHGFAVTVSLDGLGAGPRPAAALPGGRGSFDADHATGRAAAGAAAADAGLGARHRHAAQPRAAARRSTTFVGLGFHGVGFSPLLRSPTGRDELGHARAGDDARGDGRLRPGVRAPGARRASAIPFTNAVNAMRELHRGTHRPYPCGAGAGYLGVSADGDLAACHRFVGDDGRARWAR